MKTLRILVLLLGASSSLGAQIVDVSKLATIIKNANVDSTEKTERLAAIYFHEKINEYRVSKGKPALCWDDTLWLAARNHCNWMLANNELSHMEKKGTPMFNGVGPGDRYEFASKDNGTSSWSGENALYNFSNINAGCSKTAMEIANYSFEQWKASPGHNENMLNEASRVHGVAFLIDKKDVGKVWATDLFCYKPSYSPLVKKPAPMFSKAGIAYTYTPVENTVASYPSETVASNSNSKKVVKKDKFVSASSKYVKMDIEQTAADLESALYSSSVIHQSKSLRKAAQHHAEYMAANQKFSHDEKKQKRKYYAGSPQQRIVKASRGAKIFHKVSIHFVESIALISADAAAFDMEVLSKSVMEALDKERASVEGNTTAVGFGVVIKRIKNEMKVYVVREEGVKK